MLFPYYLTFEGKQLIDLISKAHFRVQENISWCANSNYAGAIIHENKTFFICTKNILKNSNANNYLNETVYHESVHVVHSCRGMKPIGIPLSKMFLSSDKLKDIDRSISLTNKKSMRRLEHEAYWLENKPKEIIKYLRKFCF